MAQFFRNTNTNIDSSSSSRNTFPTTMKKLNMVSSNNARGLNLGVFNQLHHSQPPTPTSNPNTPFLHSLQSPTPTTNPNQLPLPQTSNPIEVAAKISNRYCHTCNKFFATPYNLRRHKGEFIIF